MEDRHVGLAHGNGGRFMRELIRDVFARHLANPGLDVNADAAPFEVHPGEAPFMTTDGFTVQPLEFPGGDIGSLAVNGTVNDLAVCGARPRYLTLGAIIEEGLEVERLDRIAASIARAARESGVQVIAGDTKVVPRGQGGGLYLTTTGVGLRPRGPRLGLGEVRAGDAILVSGPIGDHAIAVMLAREQFELHGTVVSDCAPVLPLTAPIAGLSGLRFMRDPTRGGLATVAHEVAAATGHDIHMAEDRVPVRDAVRSVCEMLGYDPYYLACEGRVVAIAAPETAERILALWRALPEGAEASLVGRVLAGSGRVILETPLGGQRALEELEDDPLPRIC